MAAVLGVKRAIVGPRASKLKGPMADGTKVHITPERTYPCTVLVLEYFSIVAVTASGLSRSRACGRKGFGGHSAGATWSRECAVRSHRSSLCG